MTKSTMLATGLKALLVGEHSRAAERAANRAAAEQAHDSVGGIIPVAGQALGQSPEFGQRFLGITSKLLHGITQALGARPNLAPAPVVAPNAAPASAPAPALGPGKKTVHRSPAPFAAPKPTAPTWATDDSNNS